MIFIYYKNRLFLYWNIGKSVYLEQNTCDNVIEKYSNYYTYLFGNSFQFTRENIHLMKIFYLNFPIFSEKLETLSWEQYCLLLRIVSKKERLFYFYLILLFQFNYLETIDLVNNNYYERI